MIKKILISFNLVYGRSLLSEMREAIHQMALFVRNEPAICKLFTHDESDSYLFYELKNRKNGRDYATGSRTRNER